MFFTKFILFPAFSVKYFQSCHFLEYQQVSDNLLSRVVQIDRNSKLNNSWHIKNRNRNCFIVSPSCPMGTMNSLIPFKWNSMGILWNDRYLLYFSLFISFSWYKLKTVIHWGSYYELTICDNGHYRYTDTDWPGPVDIPGSARLGTAQTFLYCLKILLVGYILKVWWKGRGKASM